MVVAVEPERGEGPLRPWVTVVPITHRPPNARDPVVELAAPTKVRLRLDEQASWIVLTEANGFPWPGFDVRPTPGGESFLYGYVGRRLFEAVRQRIGALAREGRAGKVVPRGE